MSKALQPMKLYYTEWCPECRAVREKLEELGLRYEEEVVPDVRPFRKKVYDVSGQYYVPVLVHGDTVLTETSEILSYLDDFEEAGSTAGPDRLESSTPLSGTPDERNV